MSTRATYCILNKSFYIHYDGYLEGAAKYFENMINCKNKRGGLPERFLRGNDLAEFTGGRESHGDTEWHYTLASDLRLRIYSRTWDDGEWKNYDLTDLRTFLNSYTENIYCNWFNNELISFIDLKEKIREKLDYVKHAISKGWAGNASGALNDIFKYIKVSEVDQDQFTKEIEEAKSYTPYFVKAYSWDMPDAVEVWNKQFNNL